MAEDRFPPVILAVSLVPASVTVSAQVYVSVEAADAARASDSAGRALYLRGGKRLCVRRTSMAVDYELTHTGEQVDAALDAIDGLSELLERVVGTVSE